MRILLCINNKRRLFNMTGFKDIKKHCSLLQLIASTNKRQRRILLKSLDNDQLEAVSAVIYNFLNGTFKVSADQFKLISRHKKNIRRIAEKSVKRKLKVPLLIKVSEVLPDILKGALKSIK